jgi:hypothetical protein
MGLAGCCDYELPVLQNKLQLHELIECHDWKGVIELLPPPPHGCDGDHTLTTARARRLVSQENLEGHLALHSSELYRPGALKEAIEAIVQAYPEALSTPAFTSTFASLKCRSNRSTHMKMKMNNDMSNMNTTGMYPLHICLDTMLDNQDLGMEYYHDEDDTDDAHAGYDAYYFGIVKMLLEEAPQVAQYATPMGMLPLHYAAQLHIDGLVELLLEAYPRGACHMAHRMNALPLHLACQLNCSYFSSFSPSSYISNNRVLVPILQLFQAYPEGATVPDWIFGDEDYEYDDDDDSDDDSDGMPIANCYPLHYVCANRDLLTAPRSMELLQLLHQAHPEAAFKRDSRGQSPLSLFCQISYKSNLECLDYLLEQSQPQSQQQTTQSLSVSSSSQQYQCGAAIEDGQGRLPLHFLAEHLHEVSYKSSHEDAAAVVLAVWNRLVKAYPPALFHKERHPQQHTPLSTLLLVGEDYIYRRERGHGHVPLLITAMTRQTVTFLQTSFDGCCGYGRDVLPAAMPMPTSHLLAFFAMALHSTSGQRMGLLRQAQALASIDTQAQQQQVNGNNMLHMACRGLHWARNATASESLLHTTHRQVSNGNGNHTHSQGQGGWAQLFKLLLISGGSGNDNANYSMDNNWVQMPNHDGQLPLHLLLLSNINDSHSGNISTGNSTSHTNPRSNNVNVNDVHTRPLPLTLQAAQMLVRAYHTSASVPDPTTALMPFMSAAVTISGAASTSASTSTNSNIHFITTTICFQLLQDFVAVSDLSSLISMASSCAGNINTTLEEEERDVTATANVNAMDDIDNDIDHDNVVAPNNGSIHQSNRSRSNRDAGLNKRFSYSFDDFDRSCDYHDGDDMDGNRSFHHHTTDIDIDSHNNNHDHNNNHGKRPKCNSHDVRVNESWKAESR